MFCKVLNLDFDIGYTGVLGGTRPKNLLSALKNNVGVQRAIIVELDRATPWGHLHHLPLK